MATIPPIAVEFGEGLDGLLSGPAAPSSGRGLVLLSHGAGGTMNNGFLVKASEELSALQFTTLRWNFGYVKARRAPSAGGKRELPEMWAAIDYLKNLDKSNKLPIILAGKSFGARLASYSAIERQDIDGFAFFGLPLQGADKNAKPRDWTHLAKLTGKALFVTGDRDKLCPLDYLAEVQKHIAIPFESVVVPGDHGFLPRGEKDALNHLNRWVREQF
ncbi:MAG TPA: alpha/beta family hydrolase [Oculatellaceae cyanobacterium]